MEGVHLTALALFVLFGANWVLYGCLLLHERFSKWRACATSAGDLLGQTPVHESAGAVAVSPRGAGHEKVLSEPLSRSLSSVRNFSGELARLGGVITFAYMCEHHPPFPHNKKEHDMDMFWCMALVLFVASVLNVRKSKGGDVLNREQTEEWKGWMQFMFLNYHYFSAHEVYNSIRVFITAYVWMTGFGNFSFFYLKGDFGMVRLLQMLWRLNFLVFFLCMVMDNHYVLYYICPLHTFYFLMVYLIMAPVRSANYTKNGMRWKLAAAALFISAVWDWDIGLFDKVFWFLGREKIVGAGSGTMWEWYFRTSLDHWSTFLGMIFALNYPSTALWVRKVESLPRGRQWLIKGSASAALLGASVWWARRVLPLEKYDYNQKNAYFGVAIPVLSYIFLRNLTPSMRTRYLEPLHSLGKITLETYLMQHHVWLTSNAKTLLVFLPGFPKVNLIVVGCLYVLISRELYRLTMSLRGMCLPDDLGACLRNLVGIAVAVSTAICVAAGLRFIGAGPVTLVCVIGLLGFGVALLVHMVLCGTANGGGGSGDVADSSGGGGTGGGSAHQSFAGSKEYDRGLLNLTHTGPVLVAVLAAMGAAAAWSRSNSSSSIRSGALDSRFSLHDTCVESVNHGMWKVDSGACQDPEQAGAFCNSHEWKWIDVPDQCQFHYLPPADVKTVFSGRRIVMVGDSVERFVYYSLIRSLGTETPMAHDTSVEKHSDFSWESDDGSGTKMSFLWAPLAGDVASRVSDLYAREEFDVLIMGGGLWDALNTHGDVGDYREGTSRLHETLAEGPSVANHALTMWVTMTSVVTDRLVTDEKKQWLTDANIASYRDVLEKSGILSSVDGVIDGRELTSGQRGESYDGVHYTDLVYDAFAQVTVNLVRHYGRFAPPPATDTTQPVKKEITGMGSEYLGLMVLLLASIMVLSRDAFHGMPRLALGLFGGPFFDPKTMDWESTYGALLRKIGKHPDGGTASAHVSPNRRGQSSNGLRKDGELGVRSAGNGEGASAGRRGDDKDARMEEAESLLLETSSETGVGLEMTSHGGE